MRDFASERRRMVQRYRAQGYIKSERMAEAMLRVPRELFVEPEYMDYAYIEQPLPIPGDGRQTISAPYMYPIFYEALELREGHRVLEVGAGSGYGAALAREMVGSTGLVVTVEINPTTYRFALENLKRTGYEDVIVVLGDGSLGYPEMAPYDAICVTAACPDIPKPLIDQLAPQGRLIAPVGHACDIFGQDLVLLEKDERGRTSRRVLMKVAYVPLIGRYGWAKK
ncbi:protein-L-isoaspartate(D-aspartate) O-methyltransferase [Candidatus Bathyarchaeota archaeon]|nr:protein-L-isoaspartate(D-aspartate) O-methyltransferase [Candidatus Bathyarchaeota archaeon]